MENIYPQIKKIADRKLRKLVAAFAEEHDYYAIGKDAEDECMFASEEFVKLVLRTLGERKDLGVLSVGNIKPYSKYCRGAAGHYIVRVGRLRIDFTARQFHNNFGFPKVWEVSAREDDWVRDTGRGTIHGMHYFATR